jgi:hypothetical protein
MHAEKLVSLFTKVWVPRRTFKVSVVARSFKMKRLWTCHNFQHCNTPALFRERQIHHFQLLPAIGYTNCQNRLLLPQIGWCQSLAPHLRQFDLWEPGASIGIQFLAQENFTSFPLSRRCGGALESWIWCADETYKGIVRMVMLLWASRDSSRLELRGRT